jgi:hypothetical protein
VFERTDRQLVDWAQRVLETSQITLTPPNNSQSGQGVSLYLLSMASAFPAHASGRPPLQIALRYLVTTWADQPEEAHRLLGRLAFAAMETSEFEIEFEPLSVQDWLAFGITPRPAFVLRVPARFVRPEPDTPLVHAPLVLQSTPTTTLQGRVLGPRDMPLPDVRVDLPMLQLTARTDAHGRFRFSTVPAEPRTKQLRISAKGRQVDVTVEQSGALTDPVVIHFNPFGTEGD